MEVEYKNRKLEKRLSDRSTMVKTYGVLARKINQRIQDLLAAESLETMRSIPADRCHELKGDRIGQLAVDVSANFRLIFVPNHVPIPRKEDGGLNWKDITKILIVDIIDYH